jgi:hypothetical protein
MLLIIDIIIRQVSRNVSNGVRIFTCMIDVVVCHAFSRIIFLNSQVQINFGEGGLVQNSIISIDVSARNNLKIPCLTNN